MRYRRRRVDYETEPTSSRGWILVGAIHRRTRRLSRSVRARYLGHRIEDLTHRATVGAVNEIELEEHPGACDVAAGAALDAGKLGNTHECVEADGKHQGCLDLGEPDA
jgi:hypothetical protein